MNRREHARAFPQPSEPVHVQLMGADFLESCFARDVSEGGVAIFVPHGFESCDLKEVVNLIVTIGHEKPFMAKGIVRHTSRRYFGVHFTELSDEGRDRLREYVRRQLARADAPSSPRTEDERATASRRR